MQQFSFVQHRRTLKANYLLVQNIRALLAARGEDAKALALWAGHKPAWLSKILSGDRGIKLSDLDKIADFFGLTVAQLFQHGISSLTERRKGERRSGQDRRTGKDRRGAGDARLHPELGSPFPQREHSDRFDKTDTDIDLTRGARAHRHDGDGNGDGSDGGGESSHF